MKRFDDLRVRDLRAGDLLFYRDGMDWFSRLISWGTSSPYSHVVVYLGGGWCVESDFSFWQWLLNPSYQDGVRIIPLAKIRRRRGSHDVFRSRFRLGSLRKQALIMAHAGFRYDFFGLLWQAVVAFRWKFLARHTGVTVNHKTKYYCSELARMLFIKAGARFADDVLPEETTPASEALRPDLRFIGNLSCKR